MVFNRETISWMQSESQCIVGVGTTGNIQSSISVAPCLCNSYRDIGGVGIHTTIFPCINATCRSIDSDTWNGGRTYTVGAETESCIIGTLAIGNELNGKRTNIVGRYNFNVSATTDILTLSLPGALPTFTN